MAHVDEFQALTKAFSGLGIDEKSIISIVGKWHPEQTKSFRKGCELFSEDDHFHAFEKWNNHHVRRLELEFLRLKEAVLVWTMHPWERDARMIKESLIKGPELYGVIVEIACTRTSEELLGARKAYHSLFERSIEEDIAHRATHSHRNLFVALVSSYRYEGPRVNEESAKSEAKILADAIKNSGHELIKNEEVVRILTVRSKPHLKVVFKHYDKLYGKSIVEDLNHGDLLSLKETVECLYTPHAYFSKVLDKALNVNASEHNKDALTRVVVTRADTDMKGIKEEYQKIFGLPLSQKIEETVYGNYKDFLLTLIARGKQ